jgi:hypothetical protein
LAFLDAVFSAIVLRCSHDRGIDDLTAHPQEAFRAQRLRHNRMNQPIANLPSGF